jgi:glycerophosphoryl diester phosphodiesterase
MKAITALFVFATVTSSVSAQGICAHRGDNRHAPENTIPAFVSAVEKGVQQVEFDVDSTKDGELVILHDSTLDRTTDGTGSVRDKTLAEIKKLDAGNTFSPSFAGTRIPTLREALEAIPEHVLCNVHLKGGADTAVKAAVIIASKGRLGQCFLTLPMADYATALAARKAVPDIRICVGFPADGIPTSDDYILKTDGAAGGVNRKIEYFQLFHFKNEPLPVEHVTSLVRDLHSRGIKVNYCCASDEKGIRQIVETGADYIMTDDIELCGKALGK